MSTTHSNTLAPAGPAMWWDGGDRAITAREKALIEEHGTSCFSIPLVPATPSARWAADALPDPHGNRYACERAALTLGNLTDDELANAVFLHGNEQPAMADLAAGKALAGIVYLTAAKDRIRWLSRALVDATCKQPLHVGEPEIEFQARLMDVKTDLPTENWRHSPTYDENPGRGTHYWVQFRKRYIYYTPPAQGIDLRQFLPAVEAFAELVEKDPSPDRFLEAGRLLNLIDSQGVSRG